MPPIKHFQIVILIDKFLIYFHQITDKFLELASQLIFEAVKTLKDMETPWEPKEVDCGTKGSRGQISSEFQKVIEKLVGNWCCFE